MEHLPVIIEEYRREQRNDSRLDASRNLEDKVRQELQKVAEELEQKLAAFGLDDLVKKIAKLTKTNSLREWKRVCKDTLGIDLMDDYYNGDFYEEALRRWVDENVQKIKSIPNDTLGSMREIILDGFRKGRTVTDISKEIQKEYSVTRRKAQALARDQVSSLNAKISQMQQKDAGCSKYAPRRTGAHPGSRPQADGADLPGGRRGAGDKHRRGRRKHLRRRGAHRREGCT
ncbi:hypothetical protein [Flintibacter porci]|uniref:hypothetical protein n=1 Tax=Flintibacter porci TaxID=3342383 RepID=UPI003F8916BF